MIMNEQQYQITKEEAEKFEEALRQPDDPNPDIHPRIRQAIREGAESLLHDLRAEMAAYDALRGGRVRQLEMGSLRDVPDALIQARVAAGLTQKKLAERLGLKQQQVQRYEATRYAGVSLERLQSVADALGVQTQGRMLLTVVSTAGDKRGVGPAPA